MDYTVYIFVIIGVSIVFYSIYKLFFQKDNLSGKYIPKKLLTDNEYDFFIRLVRACPENVYVFSQVSMGAILNANSNDYEEDKKLRYNFGYKIIDFVLYSSDKKVLAIIELDDRTHNKENDYKRDIMLREAGYKILRFESKKKPKTNELAQIIRNLL